jgi:hypothetical protein
MPLWRWVTLAESYDIRFPDYLDGYEAETEAKGYLVGVVVIAQGRTFELTVYDHARLAQDVGDELNSNRAYLAVPNLLVVPSVTKVEIARAIGLIAKAGFKELTPNAAT